MGGASIRGSAIRVNHSRRPPSFLVIGSGEAGTSWLYACLSGHPEVHLPRAMRPEPHFFFKSWEYAKGFDAYLDRWFAEVPDDALAVGERSSSYIFGPEVPARIVRHLPDVRLILMLREPVDRAYSNWRFTVESGFERLSFRDAVRAEKSRGAHETDPVLREVKPHAYLARSQYALQLERFLKHFSRDRILILNSDAVKRDEPGAWRRALKFLRVDPEVPLPEPGSFPTSSVRIRRLQVWLRARYGADFDEAIEDTRREVPDRERRRPVLDRLLRANLTFRHPALDSGFREELEARFEPSNRALAPHVDWDPLRWKAP